MTQTTRPLFILYNLFTIQLLIKLASSNTHHNDHQACPPFVTPLSYPFFSGELSSAPKYGHPNFQIKCASPHSFITINNVSFAVVSYQQNSTSLFLSPRPLLTSINSAIRKECFTSGAANETLPSRAINIYNSSFSFSDSSCARLSVVKPCSHTKFPNCEVCSWECELVTQPVRLLQGCEFRRMSDQGCKGDVLDYLVDYLKLGVQVEWDEGKDSYFVDCKDCISKKGVCGFDSNDPNKTFQCYNAQISISQQRRNKHWVLLLCVSSIIICIFLVGITAFAFVKCRRWKSPENEEDPTMLFLHRQRSASSLPPVFSFEELETSTNRFDLRRKIGDGGFGTVYLGQLYDGRIVAVKRLHRPQSTLVASTKAFCNEILILSSIEHPNLVKLHGYCSDPRGLLLVYDYVPNGTLADHLHGCKSLNRKGNLTWQVRVDAALQTALALEYLHYSVEPAIVHRDITSSNIFVERDMKIKVGDFGLSRLLILPETSSTSSFSSSSGFVCTGPQGTPGYLDPDYHKSFRLTEKSDVYSFGVVLFELISGMKAVDLSRDKRDVALANLAVSKIQIGSLYQVVDPVLILEGEAMNTTVAAVAELAFRCVAADKDDRPDAKEVVAELKRICNRTKGHRSSNVVSDVSKG